MKSINKILIPTDFSDLSLVASSYVKTLSKLEGANIYLFHAIPELILAPNFPNVDLNSDTMLRDPVEMAREQLQHIAGDRFKGTKNITLIVRRGEAWREIVKFAQHVLVQIPHGENSVL